LDHESLTMTITKALSKDLKDFYREGIEVENFYYLVLSCNPKFYPISGLQHLVGSGILALRLCEFARNTFDKDLSDYDLAIAFLSGLFHDFNKWHIGSEVMRSNILPLFRETQVFLSLEDVLGEEKLVYALKDAIDLAMHLESGGLRRGLQKVARYVRVADYITGGEEYWNVSEVINLLIKELSIDARYLLPLIIGRQRPLISIVSEMLERRLEDEGAVPLVSTSTGMLFLISKEIDVERIKREIAELIQTPSEEKGEKESKIIRYASFRDFLSGRRKLATYSKTFISIAGYSPEDIKRTYEEVKKIPADLPVFITVLAYIYSKDPNKVEKGEVRVRKFIEVLRSVDSSLEVRGRKVGDMLKELHNTLLSKDVQTLNALANKAVEFIISEINKFKGVDVDLIMRKISNYINIGFQKNVIEEVESDEYCASCREPILVSRALGSYLQELRNLIRGLNISELFHPDVQGKPEKVGAISDVSRKLSVCEICYYELIEMHKRLNFADGMWASVLVYYPAMSIDLMKIISTLIPQIRERRETLPVISDYMTSRIIIKEASGDLKRNDLEDALRLWYLFGGNLVLTTTAFGSAFVWRGLPIEIEVTDIIIEEIVNEYMHILTEAEKEYGRGLRRGRHVLFTKNIRYWLYRTLQNYIAKLEESRIRKRNRIEIRLLRSGLQATGLPTIDVYSFVLNQLKKG